MLKVERKTCLCFFGSVTAFHEKAHDPARPARAFYLNMLFDPLGNQSDLFLMVTYDLLFTSLNCRGRWVPRFPQLATSSGPALFDLDGSSLAAR